MKGCKKFKWDIFGWCGITEIPFTKGKVILCYKCRKKPRSKE